MRKGILLLVLPLLIFAQTNTKKIVLDMPVRDYYGASTLKVMDERTDKNIGSLVYKGETYNFVFSGGTTTEDIERWFSKQNKKTGGRELILLIQNLNVYNTLGDNTNYCKLKMNIATFLKKDTAYYALKRYEDVLTLNPKEAGGIPTTLSKGIEKILQHVISKSFKEEPSDISLSEKEISDYYKILLSKESAFSAEKLKDGIYKDEDDFFNQNPLQYRLVRNDKNIVSKAENPDNLDEKLRADKIYAYVENGQAYKNTLEGFIPFNKDEKGFYIESNRKLIYPETGHSFGLIGALFGIVGGAIGGTIDAIKAQSEFNQAKSKSRQKVYVDFTNGQYIFKE